MSLLTLNFSSHNSTELIERDRNEDETGARQAYSDDASKEVFVSFFEDSAEKFISTMEAISLLCGEQDEPFDIKELQRLSQTITFLTEWRHFIYEPKTVNFVHEAGYQQSNEETGGVMLPQFSSAAFPDRRQPGCTRETAECKDVVLHAGGSVWAMDWCPRTVPVHQYHARCEYLAVAAHPPGSSYHKMGACLTGRGIIQIWCILDISQKDNQCNQSFKESSKKKCSRGSRGSSVKSEVSIRPRGRPRKISVPEDDSNSVTKSKSQEKNGLSLKSLVPIKLRGRPRKIALPEDDSNAVTNSKSAGKNGKSFNPKIPIKPSGRPTKSSIIVYNSIDGLMSNSPKKRGRPKKLPTSSLSSSNSNIVNDIAPSKRPSGRRRKIPGNTETLKELASDENPKSMPENVKQISHSHSKMNLLDPGTSSCDADDSFNGKTGSTSRKRRGKPIKNPPSANVVKDSKFRSCSQKKSKGIPENSSADSNPLLNASTIGSAPLLLEKDMETPKHGSKESHLKVLQSITSDVDISYLSNDVLHECLTDEGLLGTISGSSEAFVATENGCSGKCLPLPVSDKGIERNTQAEVSVSAEQMDIGGISFLRSEKDVSLPRVVLCLGHNGKVAWDVKWKPLVKGDEIFRHRLGYLGAVLGNGSLEVWEIPSPSAIQKIYKSSVEEATDPRFVKLHPVFRCSSVKCGNRQSIPLTLEWSKSTPDLILAGCHDGTVALWKFTEDFFKDTKPVLCFTADNVPIRAVCWAPGESYSESSNVIATAGHEGIKFWDIRDPYRPLWDFNPAQKMILSLDWLQHPSCLIFSFDDGTIKTLSLSNAANNVHVTGKPFEGAKHGAIHNYFRSHFAVWSVHVSPITGMAAYCGADGSTFCFQITEKSVDKDKSRHALPHYLCGVLRGTGSNSLVLSSPFPKTAIPDLPRRARGIPPHSNLRMLEKGEELEDLENPEFNQPEKRRKISKSQKKIQGEVTLVEEEQEGLQISSTSNEDFLVFPPKIVAMHRVRWNPNLGSERWLCYGGAAGIIRCQVIDFQHA